MSTPDRITKAIMKQTDLPQREAESVRQKRKEQGRCEECGQGKGIRHLPDCESKGTAR